MSISVMFYFPAYTKPYRLFFITFVSFKGTYLFFIDFYS